MTHRFNTYEGRKWLSNIEDNPTLGEAYKSFYRKRAFLESLSLSAMGYKEEMELAVLRGDFEVIEKSINEFLSDIEKRKEFFLDKKDV